MVGARQARTRANLRGSTKTNVMIGLAREGSGGGDDERQGVAVCERSRAKAWR